MSAARGSKDHKRRSTKDDIADADLPRSPTPPLRDSGLGISRSASLSESQKSFPLMQSRSGGRLTSSDKSLRRSSSSEKELIVENETIWELGTSTAIPRLLGATLSKLMDHLIESPDTPASLEELKALIIAYAHYTTSGALIDVLRARLEQLSADLAKSLDPTGVLKRRIQRMCVILEHWVKYYWPVDFASRSRDSKKLLKRVDGMLTSIAALGLAAAAGTVTALIASQTTAMNNLTNQGLSLPLFMNPCFWQMPVAKIAQQLTLIEHRLLAKINPDEFVNQAWLKSNKEQVAPNISKATEWFNRMSEWCASEILQVPTTDRVACIEWFIDLIEVFMSHNNFSSALQFVAALQRTFIQRLTYTWSLVRPHRLSYFNTLSVEFEPHNSWKALRVLQLKAQPNGAIPYLGTFLLDILYVGEQYPLNLTGKSGAVLINAERQRRVGELLLSLRTYQETRYSFTPIPNFIDWIEKRRILPDAELYTLSDLIQPKTSSHAPHIELQCRLGHTAHLLLLELRDVLRRAGAVINPTLTARATAGRVFSWDDEISIESALLPSGITYLYAAEVALDSAMVYNFARTARFFSALHLNPVCLRFVVATAACSETEAAVATRLGLDVVVVNFQNREAQGPFHSVHMAPEAMVQAPIYRRNFNRWLPLLQSCDVEEAAAKQAAARLTEQDVLLSEAASTSRDVLTKAGVPDAATFLSRLRAFQEIASPYPARIGSIFASGSLP